MTLTNVNPPSLSTDINVITAEINAYKQVAGEAIFEIGRRLKHVRDAKLDSEDEEERNLANQREFTGGWIRWLTEHVDFTRQHAHRFITIYEKVGGDGVTRVLHDRSLRFLYEIATLPPEERERPHTVPSTGETKTVDEMSACELREVKAALKKAEAAREQAESQADVLRQKLESVREQPPEIEVRTEYIRDDAADERLRRYEQRFGDIETYESQVYRIPNAADISATVQTFSYEVRGLLKKYAYLTQYLRELTILPGAVREDYAGTLDALGRFSADLNDAYHSAQSGTKIINVN
ncbi:DUF3102 domain-containing protein [Paenibacillus naphthalenovorans]|uniref:DUF3102 domain-containing protein n=1 Tax=Paenibacillus naphthalenovorans TaxID=162209 RepID=UPI003D291658